MAAEGERELRLRETLLVPHARARVFEFWRRQTAPPRFLADAEVVETTDGKRIAWRSRSDPATTAEVRLEDAPGGCTDVVVELAWQPSGHHQPIAPALGDAPARRVAEELLALDAALAARAREDMEGPSSADACVAEASRESFPASDPPAWTPTSGPGS